MLRSITALTTYRMYAADGLVGAIRQFFFDDDTWTVRYLVVETGDWLAHRMVLLSPIGLQKIDDGRKAVVTSLTRGRIRGSPTPAEIMPLRREYEAEYYRYYGWGTYWTGTNRWGQGSSPSGFVAPVRQPQRQLPEAELLQPHLRSTREVTNYFAQARRDELGHVTDFIVDDFAWALRLIVVDVQGRWPDARWAVLSPHWVERVDWFNKLLVFDVAFEDVRKAPVYDPATGLNHDFERGIFAYYGREQDLDAVHVKKKSTAGK